MATLILRSASKHLGTTISGVNARRRSSGDTDLAAVGALLADPARARVLLALADGRSLAAGVLAAEAGVSASTASHHLAKLVEARLISVSARGRHRYFTLAGPRVAELIEAVARVAPVRPITSLRQGTRLHAVRYARRCYDHLAGRLGVAVTEALCRQRLLSDDNSDVGYSVTVQGASALAQLGIPAQSGEAVRRCLDWSEQRDHIAGPLGTSLLSRFLDLGWLVQDPASRAVRLTDAGHSHLPDRLGVLLP